MTRTCVSEAELVETSRKALHILFGLSELAARLEERFPSHEEREDVANCADNLAEIAHELSDDIDTLCDFVRRNAPVS